MDVLQHDRCALPKFALPPDPDTERFWGFALNGSRLAYVRGPRGLALSDVYWFDVEACREHRVTSGAVAGWAHVFGETIIWADGSRARAGPDHHCADLWAFDISRGRLSAVQTDWRCKWRPKHNGRKVAFKRARTLRPWGPREYVILDLDSGNSRVFADGGAQAAHYAISPSHLVWSAYPSGRGSAGKNVFYLDLDTGRTHEVAQSAAGFAHEVRTWGEHLGWVESTRDWGLRPFAVKLLHIPTGTVATLAGEPGEAGPWRAVGHGSVVAWNTTNFRRPHESMARARRSDIVVYDVESRVRRRITTEASALYVWSLFGPRLIVQRYLRHQVYDYHVLDLLRLGVLDEHGHVIAGRPVLEP